MKLRKIFLTLGMAAIAMSMSAQRSFDVKLYNSVHHTITAIHRTLQRCAYSFPMRRRQREELLSFVLAVDIPHFQWTKKAMTGGEYFQNMGIAAIVLKYRMPHGEPNVPISDAEQAMKLVRLNATGWKINRNDVGIMGFSAGAHLAATIATQSQGEAKPNFQILFYPVISMMEGYGHEGSRINFLGKRPSKRDEKVQC